jgi:2-methylcitrate dehydratase PrpD
MTGNKLLEECEATEPFRQAFCLGYIMGVTDVDGMDGAAFPERRRTCVPEDVTNGQLLDILVKYLKNHPEERHYSAAVLAIKAITKAFPCKR